MDAARPGQFRLLARHFFSRFFENDLLSPGGEMHLTLAHILALLATPGLFISFFLMPKYVVMAYLPAAVQMREATADRFFFTYMSMLLMGFITVLEWDTLFPERRDYAILAPLPVAMRTIFGAKIAALAVFVAIFSLAINGISILVYPFVTLKPGDTMAYALRLMGAHALALTAACAFVFLFMMGVQGVLLNLLSARWFRRASLAAQFGAMVLLMLAIFLFPGVSKTVLHWVEQQHEYVYLCPPAWFAGLYEMLVGRRAEPVFPGLALAAVRALALALAVSALAYLASYRRHVKRSLETAAGSAPTRARLLRPAAVLLNRWALRQPLERAAFYFIAKTLARSRKHQIYLAAYVGVGFALVIQGLTALLHDARRGAELLSPPLVLSFFLLSGLRFVFTVPAELRANWTFRMSPCGEARAWAGGVRKALLLLAVAPLFAVLLPGYGWLLGWRDAALHTLFGLALSVLLAEGLLLNFRKIPFTCTYLPGKAKLTLLWAFYWFAFTTYAYTMARFEAWMLRHPWHFVWFFAVAVAILHEMGRLRAELLSDGETLVFDEQPEPAVRTLNLSVWSPRASN